MLTFQEFLAEEVKVSKSQLNDLEKTLDRLFKAVGIDIEFSKHFFDRVNDPRNNEQIKIRELRDMFRKTYDKYKDTLVKFGDNWEAVLKDVQSNINLPFVLKWNKAKGMLELLAKTVMRKTNFMTTSKVLPV
jgi:hypothetical protein